MALVQRLDFRQSQTLVMTPQLQQAIKLLQLSNAEVLAYVENELEQNPLLERAEADAPGAPAAEERSEPAADESNADDSNKEKPAEGEDFAVLAEADPGEGGDEGEDFSGGSRPTGKGGSADFDNSESAIDQTPARSETLREHLLNQINLDISDPIDRVIGVHLIDMVDEAGYLNGDLGALAALLGCSRERVEATLTRLQRFDPAGVFARGLAECLALQLRERNRLDPAMQALLDNLNLVAARDLAGLVKACGVDAEDVAAMVAEIKSLNPKPGLAFDSSVAAPVVPDILMRPSANGGWSIELNNDTLPHVLVNQRYHAELARNARQDKDRSYISERLTAANWLVKALHQRATTILRVATEIARQQDAFFRQGVQHLRPLVLRDIAAAIKMHESTVSRVTSNKFIATPRGLYELKYFFTSAIADAGGGESHSSESVRFRIKSLIDSEAGNVLSDDKIVDVLRREGIDIARRTVAKYREALHIPSSVQRRREKTMHF